MKMISQHMYISSYFFWDKSKYLYVLAYLSIVAYQESVQLFRILICFHLVDKLNRLHVK